MSKLKSNLIYNMVYQVLILIVPLITTPYVSRILLPDGLGTYSVTTAIAKYFWLFALLGMSNYGNRCIARVRNDKEKLSDTFWNLFYFQLITTNICLILYIVYIIVLGYKSYGIVSICQLPYVLSAVFEISWFFYGMEEFKFMVKRNIIIKVLTLISIFALVKTQNDVWIYVLINSISLLAGQMCLWPFLRKYISFCKPKWNSIKSHFKPNIILFASVIAVSVYTLMDKIMLEVMSTTSEVGFYENSEKIFNIGVSLIGAVGLVMLPRISYLAENKDEKKIDEYLEKSMKYIMIFAFAITFGMAGISKEFSIVFFGESFARCANVILAISPTIIFYSWENIIRNQYLLPKNKDKIYVTGTIYAAITNIILNFLLISKIGAIGAAIGTVGAQLTAVIYQTGKIRKELKIEKYIFNIGSFLIPSIIMFIVCKIIGNIMGAKILTLILQVTIGGLVYVLGVLLLLILQKDQLLMRIKNLVNREKIK